MALGIGINGTRDVGFRLDWTGGFERLITLRGDDNEIVSSSSREFSTPSFSWTLVGNEVDSIVVVELKDVDVPIFEAPVIEVCDFLRACRLFWNQYVILFARLYFPRIVTSELCHAFRGD